MKPDQLNPAHYRNHLSGVECVDITGEMGFLLGNAFKYLFRCGHKGDAVTDLEKSLWYLHRAISASKPTPIRDWWFGNYHVANDAIDEVYDVVTNEHRYSGHMAAALTWVWAAHDTGCRSSLLRAVASVEKCLGIERWRDDA